MQSQSLTGGLRSADQISLPGVAPVRRWWVLAACCALAFAQLSEPHLWMIGFDIPASAFGTAWRGYRIFANIGVVLFVAFQLIGGVLGDLFGRRRVLLIGAVGCTVFNLLALVAWNLPTLIVVRGLAGMLGALAFPLTLGMIRVIFASEERKLALLIYSFVTALGTLASLIAIPFEYWFGWRWTLVLPIVASVVGIELARRHIPESRAHGGFGRIEAIIAAAWTIVFLALVFGLAVIRTTGSWRNPITLAAGVVGVLGVALLLYWSQRPGQDGVRRRVNRVPWQRLSLLLLISGTLSFALSGYVLQLYQYFFTVQQRSGLIAGLALAPIVLGNLFTLRWASRFALTQPRYLVVGSGLGAMGVAMLLTALVRPNLPYLVLVLPMVLFGLGFLVASAAWTHYFFSALPADLCGMSAGINRAAGLIGGGLAGVVLTTVVEFTGIVNFKLRIADLGLNAEQQALALRTLDTLLRSSLTADELAQAPGGFVALGLMDAYREAYSAAISAALFVAAAVCLVGGALAWLWLRSGAELVGPRSDGDRAARRTALE